MFELMEQVAKLQAEGYTLADHGRIQEEITGSSVTPYTSEQFGAGYIVRSSFMGYPAQYAEYEIYTK